MLRRGLAALLMALPLAAAAQADAWPSRTVRLVAPFPPGGTADLLARVFAQPLSQALGQPVIVENRAGASGSVGTGFVAKSPPDGYTFVVVFDTHAVNPSLIPNLPFDTKADLAPDAGGDRRDGDHRTFECAALQELRGPARRVEGQARPASVRHDRLGQPRAPRHHPDGRTGRLHRHTRALQGRRSAGTGRVRRPRADRDRQHRAARTAYPQRRALDRPEWLAIDPANERAEVRGNVRGDIFGCPDGLMPDVRGLLWIQADAHATQSSIRARRRVTAAIPMRRPASRPGRAAARGRARRPS
jgi:hypothetical protein